MRGCTTLAIIVIHITATAAWQRFLWLAVAAVFASGPEILSSGANVWTRLGPGGGPASALAIDPLNHGTVYAATDAGLYKSADEGAGWSVVKPGPPWCI